MAFNVDMRAAAVRHLQAAEILNKGPRRDVAGYLYGLAAECAVKALMSGAGFWSRRTLSRRDDPFYAHFPELRTLVIDSPALRRSAPLMNLLSPNSFMNNWSIDMRYSEARQVRTDWVDRWAIQAREAVGKIGT
jgi:hypothetical protein